MTRQMIPPMRLIKKATRHKRARRKMALRMQGRFVTNDRDMDAAIAELPLGAPIRTLDDMTPAQIADIERRYGVEVRRR